MATPLQLLSRTGWHSRPAGTALEDEVPGSSLSAAVPQTDTLGRGWIITSTLSFHPWLPSGALAFAFPSASSPGRPALLWAEPLLARLPWAAFLEPSNYTADFFGMWAGLARQEVSPCLWPSPRWRWVHCQAGWRTSLGPRPCVLTVLRLLTGGFTCVAGLGPWAGVVAQFVGGLPPPAQPSSDPQAMRGDPHGACSSKKGRSSTAQARGERRGAALCPMLCSTCTAGSSATYFLSRGLAWA